MKIDDVKRFYVDNVVVGKEDAINTPSSFSIELKDEDSKIFNMDSKDNKKEIIIED